MRVCEREEVGEGVCVRTGGREKRKKKKVWTRDERRETSIPMNHIIGTRERYRWLSANGTAQHAQRRTHTKKNAHTHTHTQSNTQKNKKIHPSGTDHETHQAHLQTKTKTKTKKKIKTLYVILCFLSSSFLPVCVVSLSSSSSPLRARTTFFQR